MLTILVIDLSLQELIYCLKYSCIITDIDECASSPCKNSATCHNLIGAYRCECKAGYDGVICDRGIQYQVYRYTIARSNSSHFRGGYRGLHLLHRIYMSNLFNSDELVKRYKIKSIK